MKTRIPSQKIWRLIIIIGIWAITATVVTAYYYHNYQTQSRQLEALRTKYNQLLEDYNDLKSDYQALTGKIGSATIELENQMPSAIVVIGQIGVIAC